MASDYLSHILRMILASAICTAMIGFGLLYRRKDNSRRWLFFAAGILGSVLTVITITVNSSYGSDSSIAAMEFIVGAGLLFLAAPMLFVGKRGRRVGDHPLRRKCGFDLFGKPPESTRCSECGADLQLPKATVVGVRRMRVGWLLGGIFTLCLGLMLAGQPAYQYGKTIDFYQYRPTSWVLDDLKSNAAPTQGRALRVIEDRLQDPNLSRSQAKAVVNFVLSNQSNPFSWELYRMLTDVIDKRDVLDEETTRRFMRAIPDMDIFQIAPVLVLGRPISVISFTPPISASGQKALDLGMSAPHTRLLCKVTAESVQIGKIPIPTSEEKFDADANRLPGFQIDPSGEWAKLSPGSVTISRDVTFRITLNYKGKQLVETVPCSRTATSQFMTLANATPAFAPPTPADLNNTWTATLRVNYNPPQLEIGRSGAGSRVVARVALINKNVRTEIGSIDVRQGSLGESVEGSTVPKFPDGDFQVELTPSPIDAATGLDMTPVLNQTIRIPTVKREGDSNGS